MVLRATVQILGQEVMGRVAEKGRGVVNDVRHPAADLLRRMGDWVEGNAHPSEDHAFPIPNAEGIIEGESAARITRAQWESARSRGEIVVFYDSETDPVGRVFSPSQGAGDESETLNGSVHHARVVRLSGGITLSKAIAAHDHEDFTTRMNEGRLGFGDEEKGLIHTDGMVVSIHDGKEWMEHGEVLPLMEFSQHPNMQAIHYGSALFEGMGCERNEAGKVCVFDIEGHYARLKQGADRFELPMPSFEQFKEAVIAAVKANARFIPEVGKGRLYVRPNLYSAGAKMKVGNAKQTALVITTTPIGNASSYFGNVKEEVVFGVPTNRIRSAEGLAGNTKAAGNYAPTIEAIRIMKELGLGGGGVAYLNGVTRLDPAPEREAFESRRAWLAAMAKWTVKASANWLKLQQAEFKETNASNLLAFEPLDGGRWRVATPPLDEADILAGRTRDLIREICAQLGWEFEERPIPWHEIKSGKYAYMAGSGTGAYLTPIHAFQRVTIGSREDLGEIDEAALDALSSEEAREAYKRRHVGRKEGKVVHLLGRPPKQEPEAGELFPAPILTMIHEMERVKRGESLVPGLDQRVTRVVL